MANPTIGNAANIPLNVQTGSIPNMGDSLRDWFQLITFNKLTKTTIGFQVQEIVTAISFWGIVQPLGGRDLLIKPEGQRQWNWLSVICQASPVGDTTIVNLSVDDVLTFLGTQYRVMKRANYGLYSYLYYELVQDYTGGVPTP